MKEGYPQALCIGIPLDVQLAAVKYISNEMLKEMNEIKETLSPDKINEYRRIKYNFRANEVKESMADQSLIDVVFKKNSFSIFANENIKPLSVPIVIFSGIDPELIPRV